MTILAWLLCCLLITAGWQSCNRRNNALSSADEEPVLGPRLPKGIAEAVPMPPKVQNKIVRQKRVDPPFWWIGMNQPTVELLIHDYRIKGYQASVKYPGLRVKAVHKVASRNYLFIELEIGPEAAAGPVKILLSRGDDVRVYDFELKNKATRSPQPFSPADCAYLLIPDRFSNGDSSNDSLPGMAQQGIDRNNPYFRHGGDLQGIIDKLDYLQNLGITTLVTTSPLKSDQPYDSYLGNAITDHYRIDPRLGSNDLFKKLVEAAHSRGIKVVMETTLNHVGDQHWWVRDLPDEGWIHPPDSGAERTRAWIDTHMPDLNQQSPRLARYLTQNSLWWAQFAGLDGLILESSLLTNPYFLEDWKQYMQQEKSQLGLFANVVLNIWTDPEVSQNTAKEIINLYVLENGFSDSEQALNCMDHYLLPRLFSAANRDLTTFKTLVAFLMTQPGIPMLYYGSEVLLDGVGKPAKVAGRVDFPGGWLADKTNKFKPSGRLAEEEQAFRWVQKLVNIRKHSTCLQEGKLHQYTAKKGVHTYLRIADQATILVAINRSDSPKRVETSHFRELAPNFTQVKDVISEHVLADWTTIELAANDVRILEFKR